MSVMPLLWIVWAGLTTVLLVLLVYRANLTRYEEDQIFLDEASSHQEQEQTIIVRRVAKVQPFVRLMTGLTCAMTVAIIGIYVWDAVRHFYT
jgi:hypothetical protein